MRRRCALAPVWRALAAMAKWPRRWSTTIRKGEIVLQRRSHSLGCFKRPQSEPIIGFPVNPLLRFSGTRKEIHAVEFAVRPFDDDAIVQIAGVSANLKSRIG
jgi:hypothetical protein